MQSKRTWITGVFFGLVAVVALIATPTIVRAGSLQATLDRTRGTVDDQFVYRVTISGNFDQRPSFPDVDGLQVLGTQQSSQTSIINGRMSHQVDFHFTIEAAQPGEYLIPPLRLTVDGKELMTESLKLVVTAASSGRATTGEAGPAFFVERELSNTRPYVGEPIVVITRFFYRVRLSRNPMPMPAELSSFRVIEMSDDQQRSYRRQVGEYTYQVIELKRILVPLQVGEQSLAPEKMRVFYVSTERRRSRGIFDMFQGFQTEKEQRVSTQPNKLTVLPLPKDSAPQGFSGIVGPTQVEAKLSSDDLQVGDTATLTLSFTGQTILDDMPSPDLNLPQAVKVYADKPEGSMTLQPDGQIAAQRTFKFALVPTQAGPVDLGTYRFIYFDPQAQAYQVAEVALGQLAVGGRAEEVNAVVATPSAADEAKQAVETLARDLVDLHRNVDLTRQQGYTASDTSRFLALWLGPLLLFATTVGIRRRKSRFDQNSLRRSKAYRYFRNESEEVEKALGMAPKQGLEQLYGAFRVYIGDKLTLPGRALTAQEIVSELRSRGFENALESEAGRVLSDLERLEFAGAQVDPERANHIFRTVQNIVKEVERKC